MMMARRDPRVCARVCVLWESMSVRETWGSRNRNRSSGKELKDKEKYQAEVRILSPSNSSVEVFLSKRTHFPGGNKGELFR